MKNFNLLYCFDEGYNLQTYASIHSISKNLSNSQLNIFIIHKNPDTFDDYKQEIEKLHNVSNVYIFEFTEEISNYPNLKNSHVSEATYYRLFISKYIPHHVDHIIYLDSDVFCINDAEYTLEYSIQNLLRSTHTISASTEIYKTTNNKDTFRRLDLENERYFNAGVMIIDYEKWIKNISIDEVVNLLKSQKNNLNNWDQDLLNIVFDGDYLELTNFLNFRIYYPIPKRFFINYSIFIHFAGNHKPWTLEGSYDSVSSIYFQLLDELGISSYNIKLKSQRLVALRIFIKYIVTLQIIKVYNPVKMFIENLKSFGRN